VGHFYWPQMGQFTWPLTGRSVKDVAALLGVNRSTLYRTLGRETE